ncbi:MAG TPA: L,D-transpeptidase [Bdellovibrionota bacterium]|jgi:hypothetical protein|nr:L,D-transpeptidase [Bdellovibrionota bacterium]
MTRASAFAQLFLLLVLAACGGGDSVQGDATATREFRDRADSAEVQTALQKIQSSALMAAKLPAHRRTPVEIYILKKPDFVTYAPKNRDHEKRSVLLLVVDGELITAALTSTGNPNRIAKKTLYDDNRNKIGTTKARGDDIKVGTYSIERSFREKTSDSFGDARMNYALFFFGGIAIHETTGYSNYKNLGKPASMGCIRVNTAAASDIFEAVTSHAERNDKNQIVGYSKTTVNVVEGPGFNLFTQIDILRAIKRNFMAEKALGRNSAQFLGH